MQVRAPEALLKQKKKAQKEQQKVLIPVEAPQQMEDRMAE